MTLTRLIPALFAVAALTAPAAGQTAEDIKELNKKLDALSKSLQDLKDGAKADNVREKVATIDSKIDQLDQDIQAIKKDLRELKRKVDGGSSTSLRPGFDSATGARVRIVNTHPYEMSVVLNNLSYRLAPGEEKLIRVPAGSYNLELLNFPGERRSGELAAGETKTFTIFPR
jgi:outer membrane murein-binding lipoprotein Lpp